MAPSPPTFGRQPWSLRVYFVLLVLAMAVVASLVRGGRFRRLADAPIRFVWLVFAGVGLQLAADLLVIAGLLESASPPTYGMLLVSQLIILGWLLANWQIPGLTLVAIGLALNAVVIAANGAMPVDPEAIAALGRDGSDLVRGKHILLDDQTRLWWLADIWPLPLLRSIISVGDVVLAAGLIPITHYLMSYEQPSSRRRRRTAEAPAELATGATPPEPAAPEPEEER